MTGVICQLCGAANPDGRDRCGRCGTTLMVVSGFQEEPLEITEEAMAEAQEEFEEHLIERISDLEDSVRRLSAAVAATGEHLAQLEHNLTVAHAGIQSLGGLLETHGVLSRAELVDGWERTAEEELLSRDLSRRFRDRAARILSLAEQSGRASAVFRRKLRAVEMALMEPETDAAADLLVELARLAPDNDELWGLLGEIAFEAGDAETARDAFRRVVEMRGSHFESLIYLGATASELGDAAEAEDALERARRIAPESFLPPFILGAAAAVRGQHERAVELLEVAVAREPAPQALYLLGTAYLHLGKTGLAIERLRLSVDLRPEFEDALYQLGVAYLRRGWSKLAMETFQQVLSLDPQRLQYQETVRMLELEPPTNLPEDVARIVARAEAALERDRPESALELFRAASRAAPREGALQATVALLASALGRTRDAVTAAHRLLEDGSTSSPYVAAGVVALLESLRQAGRPRAVRRLAEGILRDATDQLVRGLAGYELAMVESELGDDLDRAREVARSALEVVPRELRHYPLAALGAIALKRGRYREAIQYLEQAADGGRVAPVLRQLAVARLGAGDTEGAEAALAAASPETEGGIDEELLDHVRRLGALLKNSPGSTNGNRTA